MNNGIDNGIELTLKFPDNATAEEWLEKVIWRRGLHCPRCGCYGMISECPDRKPQKYWCGDCRKHFSVRTETVMSHSKIPLEKWATAFYLHVSDPKGINAMQLSRKLKLNYRSAWFMLHRIREGWSDQEPLRSRIAEIDEAYFGGDDKKKHRNKKFHKQWRYGNTAVAGMVDRETGNVAAKVILTSDRETLFPFAEEHLCPEGTLNSDNGPAYGGGFGWPGRHETVNHKNEFVRGDVHTNSIESFWALAKRIYRGIYHHISPKYFPRYLNEMAGRYNTRGMDILEQMELLASGIVGKRLTYRDLVDTEVPPVPFTHHRSKERASLFE